MHLLDVLLDIVHANTGRSDLQQYTATATCEGHSGQENHDGDEDANSRVGIVSCVSICLPDDQGCDDYAHIVDCIANNVDQHAEHTEVSPGVARCESAVLMLDMFVGVLLVVNSITL